MSNVDDFIKEQLEEIDEQIQKIENSKVYKQYQQLQERVVKLRGARQALLGAGPKLTGGTGGKRTTQAEVVEWFKANCEPGESASVEVIAKALSVSPEVVRGHLNRGKDERFLSRTRGIWALRDPENEINTVDDLED